MDSPSDHARLSFQGPEEFVLLAKCLQPTVRHQLPESLYWLMLTRTALDLMFGASRATHVLASLLCVLLSLHVVWVLPNRPDR